MISRWLQIGSLKVRILLLIAVAIVTPLFALGTWLYWDIDASQEKAVSIVLETAAKSIASQIESWNEGPNVEVESFQLGQRGFLCVLAPDGHIVSAPEAVLKNDAQFSWLARTTPQGIGHVVDHNGQEWLTYGTVLKSGLRILALQDEEEEDAAVHIFRKNTILMLCLAAGLTLPFASLFLSSVLRPIKQLQEAAEALRKGDWSIRVQAEKGAELAALAHSFNQMAEQLGNQYVRIEEEVAKRTEQLVQENAERRLAERSLRAKQEELQAMNDASPLGIFVTGRDGLCLYSNQVLQDIYGTPQLFGSGLFEPIHEEDKARVLALFKSGHENGQPLKSIHRLRRRKRILWLRMRLAPLGAGDQFTGYVGTVEDISEQKLLEHRLLARNQMMDTLASSSHLEEAAPAIAQALADATEWDLATFWVVDLAENRLKQVGAAQRKTLDLGGLIQAGAEKGLEKGQGLPGRVWKEGQPLWIGDADKDLSDPRLAFSPPLRTALALPIFFDEAVAGVVEVRFRDPILSDSSLIEDLCGWADTLGQFLARSQAEKEKGDMEIQLRHAQKMESIGQLAAGIAHEINTPTQFVGDNNRFLQGAFSDIAGLLHRYDLLLTGVKAGCGTEELSRLVHDAEETAEAADIAYLEEEVPKAILQSLDGLERVTKIVRAMKDFSHPGSEDRVPVNLNQAIESTVTVARNEWKYVADLATELDPDLPPVPCRIGEINQVVLNLLVNAAHAIGDILDELSGGKGMITVSTKTSADREWAEVRISDTGGGIPEAIRGKIFDPFFTTKQVGKGTGQGLAIAHSVIVDKHGGTIAFESEIGKGTTFLIRLPLHWERSESSRPK
ncbi:PAS domain S-box-containing protein [Verrucomicrobium sp. GAS474]|uniref:ATP-binding protein n=1 Tax=Verrucomicrobium sp. GAS474 TaxID=1882831 RepID=UPI00087B1BD6|nr:ATP-binding protein [Verrucomicrobium sp. GAS474]SDU20399.1 PAS domain S-box-containing protein [Verrucomicrobium sp. GAS474]